MTIAMIIATVWTRVSSSGKPMSTMRSGLQACLIKIEATGAWEKAADGPSDFRSRDVWTGCALRPPNQPADHVPGDPAGESDDENLEPFPPPRPDRDLRFVPADPEKGDPAQYDREDRSEEHVAPDEEERTQRDEMPHDGRGPDEGGARPRSTRVDGGQLEFEGHHEFELRGRVAADSLHELLEIGVVVAPPPEDLADLVPFRLRDFLHLPTLLKGLAQVEPSSRPGRSIGDGPHGNRFRPEGGEGRDQNDTNVAGRRRQAQDDPEDIDDSVLTSEDEVGEACRLRMGRAFSRHV